MVLERRSVQLWYYEALRTDDDLRSLLVRVREDVSYPRDWMKYPLSVNDVKQSATLESWWCKPVDAHRPHGPALTALQLGSDATQNAVNPPFGGRT